MRRGSIKNEMKQIQAQTDKNIIDFVQYFKHNNLLTAA